MKRFIKPLATMEEHARMDRLIQGKWTNDKDEHGVFRGCFFGCAAQSDYDPIETVCGQWDMPFWLGHLSEEVFEGLSPEDAKEFPVQLLERLVQVDESFNFYRLRHDLAILRLTKLLNENVGELRAAIGDVIEYHKNPNETLREQVGRNVSAVKSPAGSAERVAIRAALYSARSESLTGHSVAAAVSAAVVSESSSKSEAWKLERDNLLSLIK